MLEGESDEVLSVGGPEGESTGIHEALLFCRLVDEACTHLPALNCYSQVRYDLYKRVTGTKGLIFYDEQISDFLSYFEVLRIPLVTPVRKSVIYETGSIS